MKHLRPALHLAALLFAALVGQSYAQNPLTNGLVAYYSFNGNANDESGNGNHGTVQEAALASDRFTQASRAYSFDGVNDQITVAHSTSISPTNEVTVAAWIRPLAYEDNKHCVSKGSHVNYLSRSYSLQGPWADGKWRAALSTPSGEVVVASGDNAALTQWSQVLMTYDGTTVKLYLNGQLSGSQAATGLITETSEELLLGSHKFYAASDYWFNGGIDDVRIYNRAFSAAEVAQLHASEALTPLTAGLVAYYPFTGSANDESGNGNHGAVQEAALANDRFTQASRAYSFDGVNDQIVVAHSASVSPTNEVTVAAWVRPLAYEDNKHCVSKGSHVNYFSRSYSLQGPWADGKWRATLSTPTGEVVVASLSDAALGAWNHVLMSYDGTTVKLYVNGQLSGTQPATGLITQTSEELLLGSHKFYAASDYWFEGGIDDVRIYNRTLSATEVARLHASEAVPPIIAVQPASVAASVGNSASFNVTATGSELLSYQWLKDGLSVPGATSATLTLSTLQTNQAGGYSLVITNVAGSITSSVAALTVNQLSQTITFGALPGKRVDDAPFSLTATASSGLPVNYSSSDSAVATVSSGMVTITGIGSTTLTASQAGDATYLPATSVNHTLTVAGIPPGISSQPTALAINVTSNAAFNVTGTGTAPLAYQWRKDGVNLGGATGASLSLVNVQTNQAGNYSVVITNTWGSITSSVAALAVNRLSQTLTFGALAGKRVDDGPFTLSATTSSGLPVSFNSSDSAVASVGGTTVTITGVGSATITASQAGDATYLPATSVNRTLAVAGIPPGISSQPTGLTVNVTATATFGVTATGTAPLSYQWRKDGVDVGGATGATLGLANVQTNQDGNYSVVITNTWGSITSSVVGLTVNRLVQTITFGALAGKRVDDGPFSLTATANSGLPVGFSSSVTSVATVSGSTVTISGVGSTTLTASQGGDATYLPASSVSQTLVVSAPPAITTPPIGQSFTLGSGLTLSVNAVGTGPLFYQWQLNGTNIPGATGSTLNLANLTATNAGAYRVVVSSSAGGSTISQNANLLFHGDMKFYGGTTLGGPVGQQFRVDYADVVTVGTTNWLVLTNITLPASPYLVIDPNSPGRTQRYYRAVPLP